MKVPYQWPTNDNRIVVLEKRKLASSKILGAFALATRPVLLERVSWTSYACDCVRVFVFMLPLMIVAEFVTAVFSFLLKFSFFFIDSNWRPCMFL